MASEGGANPRCRPTDRRAEATACGVGRREPSFRQPSSWLGGKSRRSFGSREEPGTDVRSATANRSHRVGFRPGPAGAAVASHGGWMGAPYGGRQHGRNRQAGRGGGMAVSVTAWSTATVTVCPSAPPAARAAVVGSPGREDQSPRASRGGRSHSARFRLATPQGSAPPPTGIVTLRVADRSAARSRSGTSPRPHHRRVGRVCTAALPPPGVIVMPRPPKESRWLAPSTATPARSPVPGGGHHARTR